jgi:hypothetical protein
MWLANMIKSHLYRTSRLRAISFTSAGIVLGSTLLLAYSDWAKKDASEWTDSDVRAILTDSPWTKQAKLNFAGNMGGGNPGGTGRMGGGGGYGGGGMGSGGGMGGGGGMGSGGGYGGRQGGMGGSQPGGGQQDRYVTLQWISSAPVRLALLKRQPAGQAAGDGAPNFEKPMDQYVLAVSGFPAGGGGWNRQSAGQDGDIGASGDRPQRDPAQMAERLKASSSLDRKGHDPIHPDKVTWDDSNGTRVMMLFFPKTDPITLADKDVEVQIAMGPMEIKKKFALKEMVYQGKLEL